MGTFYRIAIILVILVVLFLWNWCLPFYHEKHTEKLPAPDESKCFSEKCKSIILTQQSDKAILLIHGFPSSPQIYQYAAKRFFEEGYDVYAPLMPGFGTSIEDFTQTSFCQWFDYMASYYERLRKQYPTMHVLGISMGGAITLKLAETYCDTPQAPDAICTIAAPVVYNSLHDRIITNPLFAFSRSLTFFKDTFDAYVTDHNPKGDDGNEDWTGYHGLFISQGLSLIYNLKFIRHDLKKISCPFFAIQDKKDKTVPFGNLGIIQRENISPHFSTLETDMEKHNHTYHCLLMYHSIQKQLTDTILAFFKEYEHDDKA